MKGSTHLAAGLVAAVVLQTEPTLVVTTGVAIGALLPDIDSSTSLVGRYIPVIPSVLKHRTITHTFWLAAVLAVICPPIAVGVMTHLILDVLNPEGLHPFWPVKWKLRIPGISYPMPSGGLVDRLIGAVCWIYVLWTGLCIATQHPLPLLPANRFTIW